MKAKVTTISLLLMSIAMLAISFVYAYFYQKEEKIDERIIGEVLVETDLYFLTGSTRTNGTYSKILEQNNNNGYTKTGVFEVVLANINDPKHLNNLRIDFKVNSTVDTYFRIKLQDSIVMKSIDGKRETTLANTGIKYHYKEYEDDIDYEEDDGDSEFWFLDKTTNWFYYKLPVNGLLEELIVPFIYGSTGFSGATQNRRLEILIKIEAVQAHLGPQNNWSLEKKPWNGDDWT